MSRAFRIYFITKAILDDNPVEGNEQIFRDILDALVEDIRTSALSKNYTSHVTNEDGQEEENSQTREEIIEDIFITFQKFLDIEIVFSSLLNLRSYLSSINQPLAANVIAQINNYIYINSSDDQDHFYIDEEMPKETAENNSSLTTRESNSPVVNNTAGLSREPYSDIHDFMLRERAESITDYYLKNNVMSGSVGSGIGIKYHSNPGSYVEDVLKILGKHNHYHDGDNAV